jgi:transcriptional antiterminator RfaH
MTSWHCVYTKSMLEIWARANLWERGFEAYLPQYRKRRSHARRTELIPAPLFPRYMFVRADLGLRGSRAIASAPGVSSLVAFGNGPAPVPEIVVSDLRALEDKSGMIDVDRGRGPASRYAVGDRVRVHKSALLDRVGLFQCREDSERVVILLNLLGRDVRVRIHADALSHES